MSSSSAPPPPPQERHSSSRFSNCNARIEPHNDECKGDEDPDAPPSSDGHQNPLPPSWHLDEGCGHGPCESASLEGMDAHFGDEDAEAYEKALAIDDTRSISTSVYAHIFENGRRYHRFRHGRYPLPNDDDEQNREDMKHAMMLELTEGRLFLAPVGSELKDVLDLGTGTGIWCIDMGDQYPDTNVIGLDLSPIQPEWVPPNVKFLVDDMEDDWLFNTQFDLIHMRIVMSFIKDPAKVLASCYRQTRPGGWVELQEIHAKACCDDGTMPRDYPVKVFYELVQDAFRGFGSDMTVAPNLIATLESAGFINVQEEIIKVPIGTWAQDKTLRLVGLYWRMAIMELLPAMGGKPFLSLGMSRVEIEVFFASVRKALMDTRVHAYVNFHFVYGQKPLE